MRGVASLSSVLLLAACSSQPGGNASGNTATGGGSTTAASSSSINLTDACAALPRDAVGQALGLPAPSAELKDVMTDTGNGMMGSNCVYDFGDIKLVMLQLNRFPNGADMASIFDQTRSMMTKDGSVPVEDVPGLGQRAFWIPSRTELYIMLDDNRQVMLSIVRMPDVADPKQKLVTLARRVIG